MGDPKKMGAAIAARMPPPDKLKREGGEEEGDSDAEGEAAALESAVGEFFALGKSGDIKGAAEAFVDLVRMCRDYE